MCRFGQPAHAVGFVPLAARGCCIAGKTAGTARPNRSIYSLRRAYERFGLPARLAPIATAGRSNRAGRPDVRPEFAVGYGTAVFVGFGNIGKFSEVFV